MCNAPGGNSTLAPGSGVSLLEAGTLNSGNRTLSQLSYCGFRKCATNTWMIFANNGVT
jgi:hypothetical protein